MKRTIFLLVAILFAIYLVIVKPYPIQKILAALGGVGFTFLLIKTYISNKNKP